MSEDSNRARLLRREMVEKQIKRRGVHEERVLEAMLEVPRHLFMKGYSLDVAYGDHAMPIGHGQTISQPYMVAIMSQVLVRSVACFDKVLEIGAGSGYQAAILSLLFRKVITVERVRPLAEESGTRLKELGYSNVTVITGDGTLGYAGEAPYDGIIVTAAAPRVPSAVKEQLNEKGSIVIPVGSRFLQYLEIIKKKDDTFTTRSADGCVFVPLIGVDGWGE